MLRKRVYLTIDDGPSKDFKRKVDYLYDREIHAVFFCVGEKIEKRFDDVVYAIEKGFAIGNHSYEHRYFSDLTLEQGKASISLTDELIDRAYSAAGVSRSLKLFRFPHFDQGGENSKEDYENRWNKEEHLWFINSNDEKRDALQKFLRDLDYSRPAFSDVNQKYFIDSITKESSDDVDIRCTFDQMEYFLGIADAPYGMCEERAILERINEDFPYMGRPLNTMDTADVILVHDQEKTTELFFEIIDKYLEKRFLFKECN